MKKLQQKIYYIIREEEDKSFWGEVFDWVMLFLIVVNLLLLILDTFTSSMPPWYWPISQTADTIMGVIFTIEYLLRLWVSPIKYPALHAAAARVKFAFTPMAIIDFLAVLPLYLKHALPVNLRFLRIFRLIRLLRLFKISRYTESMSVFTSVFKKKANQLLTSLFVIFLLILIASLLMYDVEHDAQPDVFSNALSGLWWAMEAVTTAGNGDIYPITPLGRALAGIIALMGIGVVAVPTGIISAGFITVMHENSGEPEKTGTPASELALFKDLLDDGAITQQEYDQKKQQLLAVEWLEPPTHSSE